MFVLCSHPPRKVLLTGLQDNIQAACQRIEDAGYKFQKKLSDGRMKHIAFALDPDGYCESTPLSAPPPNLPPPGAC